MTVVGIEVLGPVLIRADDLTDRNHWHAQGRDGLIDRNVVIVVGRWLDPLGPADDQYQRCAVALLHEVPEPGQQRDIKGRLLALHRSVAGSRNRAEVVARDIVGAVQWMGPAIVEK